MNKISHDEGSGMKTIKESTKITLTIGQLKRLVKESLDYYRCHRCGSRVREDDFSLPSLFNSYFVKDYEKEAWDKFIDSHSDKIEHLGIEPGRYGILFEPVCPKCCKEISGSPEYAALEDEWERAKKESLGGKERESELEVIANRVMENIATLKSALLDMYGSTANVYPYKLEIERRRYGSKEWVGDIKWYPSFGEAESMSIVSDRLKKGEPLPATLQLCKAGFTWSDNKYKDVDLGIDMMTADREQVLAAVKSHKDEIWNFV